LLDTARLLTENEQLASMETEARVLDSQQSEVMQQAELLTAAYQTEEAEIARRWGISIAEDSHGVDSTQEHGDSDDDEDEDEEEAGSALVRLALLGDNSTGARTMLDSEPQQVQKHRPVISPRVVSVTERQREAVSELDRPAAHVPEYLTISDLASESGDHDRRYRPSTVMFERKYGDDDEDDRSAADDTLQGRHARVNQVLAANSSLPDPQQLHEQMLQDEERLQQLIREVTEHTAEVLRRDAAGSRKTPMSATMASVPSSKPMAATTHAPLRVSEMSTTGPSIKAVVTTAAARSPVDDLFQPAGRLVSDDELHRRAEAVMTQVTPAFVMGVHRFADEFARYCVYIIYRTRMLMLHLPSLTRYVLSFCRVARLRDLAALGTDAVESWQVAEM